MAMALNDDRPRRTRGELTSGFSLLEMLVSVAIITLLMSAVFGFMYQAQKRFQGNVVVSESNQSARAALEVMTQEIGQAGYNPQFLSNKTCNQSVSADAAPQCITLNDITQINPGDWLTIDAGPNTEIVAVTGTTTNGVCVGSNKVQGVFEMSHDGTSTPFPVVSYKFSYPTGILVGTGTSDDHTLMFFGDINNDGVIRYVVYSLNPTTSPATTVNVTTGPAPGTYTLYNLYRSITPVGFPATVSAGTNQPASMLVQNV